MDENLNESNRDGDRTSAPSEPVAPAAKKSPAKRPARRAAAPAGPPPVPKRAATANKTSSPSRPPVKPVPPVTFAAPQAPAPAAKRADPPAPVAKKAAAKKPAKKAPAVKKVAEVKPEPTEPAEPAEPAEPSRPVVVEAPAAVEPPVAVGPAPVVESAAVVEPAPVVERAAATPPASESDVERAWKDNRLAQVLYHDWEADSYDEKWSISFDDRCITYARDRFSALVGPEVLRTEEWPYAKALEIGAGTGFFSLNLRQAGVVDEVHVSDVSAGMVDSAKRNAHGLGFEVTGTVAGAEALPYEDDTFDLVLGHAVIHHIPDVESALREVLRVLKPGGRFVIAGEPTKVGDWYARQLGRATWKVTTAVTQLPPLRQKWAKSKADLDASSRAAALEAVVDLHTFVPEELVATAERAGAEQVRTQTEELLAAFLGWPVRTFEAAVNPEALGWGWAMFAYRSWQRLSALDRVLARALPQSIFYNVGVTGTKPNH
jgi:ubiquinone/menaquinone biosynthesis C-methylase UbiE